jgi:hypothetical protein
MLLIKAPQSYTDEWSPEETHQPYSRSATSLISPNQEANAGTKKS